jgi:hypothetical protein
MINRNNKLLENKNDYFTRFKKKNQNDTVFTNLSWNYDENVININLKIDGLYLEVIF